MLQQILTQLMAKNPGVSKIVLGLIAQKLVAKVTDASGIEAAITDFVTNSPLTIKEIADFHQSESDKRVTAAVAKFKTETDTVDDPDDGTDQDNPKPKVKDKPVKGQNPLEKKVDDLTKQLSDLLTKENKKSLSQQLHAKLGEKKIPLEMAKGRIPDKEEDLETVFAEIEADYKAIVGTKTDDGSGNFHRPPGGNGVVTPATEKKIEADIGAWADKGKKAETAKV